MLDPKSPEMLAREAGCVTDREVWAFLAGYAAAREWREIDQTALNGKPCLVWKENTREQFVAAYVHGEHGHGWCTPDGFELFKVTRYQPLPTPPKEGT